MNNTLEKPSIETEAKAPTRLRDRLFGRAVFRGMQLLEAASILKSRQTEARGAHPLDVSQIPRKNIDPVLPEYPGRHNLEKGKTTVDTLVQRNAQEKIDSALAEGAQGKTFSSESGDFHFSSDLSGKVEGASITKEELNNRTPMSPSYDDIVIFPARPPQKKAPDNHLEGPAAALPTEEYKIPPQQPYNMN